ncbi:MAG TPA: type II toxin-antitoxin system VapC family toxin [Terracidiphilus sp.]|nr:type II toxin-antitoxin system VapC family toxin [Terracidiphilus sp.]
MVRAEVEKPVKITVDTNVLVRAAVRDDRQQADAAVRLLRGAELIAVPLPALCELAWVLDRVYSFSREEIAAAISALLDAANVAVNRPAVEAGLDVFRAGGDFADGVIAFEGRWLGGEVFASFDKRAVTRLARLGVATRQLL